MSFYINRGPIYNYVATRGAMLKAKRAGILAEWKDIQDIRTLYQDAAGTTPATVGGEVLLVKDKVNAARNWTSTVGNGPVLRQNATTGLYYLEIAAASADLIYSAANFTPTSPVWMVAAVTRHALSTGVLCGIGVNGTNRMMIVNNNSFFNIQPKLQSASGSFNCFLSVASAVPGLPLVVDMLTTTTTCSAAVNGSALRGSTAGTTTQALGIAQLANSRTGFGNTGTSANSDAKDLYGFAIVLGDVTDLRDEMIEHMKACCGLIWMGRRPTQTYMFGILAQSQALSPVGSYTTSDHAPFGTCWEYLDAPTNGGAAEAIGCLKPAYDPVRGYDNVVLAGTGSFIPPIAKAFYETSGGRMMGYTNGAKSGQGLVIGEWNPAGTLLATLARKSARMVRHYEDLHPGTPGRFPGLICQTGENDATNGVTTAQFRDAMGANADSLTVRARTLFPAEFTTAGCSAQAIADAEAMEFYWLSVERSTTSDFADVRAGQVEGTDGRFPEHHMISPYVDLNALGELGDALHWNQAGGNRKGGTAGTNLWPLIEARFES